MCKFSNQKRKSSLLQHGECFDTWVLAIKAALSMCQDTTRRESTGLQAWRAVLWCCRRLWKHNHRLCCYFAFSFRQELPFNMCLQQDAFILNTAKTQFRLQSILIMKGSFNEKGRMACHRRAGLGLGQSQNKVEEARNETPECRQTMALEALFQSHHKQLQVLGCTAFAPRWPLLHS